MKKKKKKNHRGRLSGNNGIKSNKLKTLINILLTNYIKKDAQ